MFLVNSRLQSFVEGPFLPKRTRPYPEVTAAVLPSSLTMFLSYTLVLSHPSTCVGFGTGRYYLALEDFLDPFSFPLPQHSWSRDDSECICRTDLPIRPPQTPNAIAIGHRKFEQASPHRK